MIKVLISIFFTILSVVINCFLLIKSSKRYLVTSLGIIIFINLVMFLLDMFQFNNEILDYIAFEMLLSFLLSITFEDIKSKLIDTRVLAGYLMVFLIYRIIFMDLTIFLEGIIGMIISLIILLIAYFINKNSIGIGDIETIAICGLIIGFPNIFHFLFKTFLFVFIFGLFLIIAKKKNIFTEIPLAPFLLLATII